MDKARRKSLVFLTWDMGPSDYLSSLFFPILSRVGTEKIAVKVYQWFGGKKETANSIRITAGTYKIFYSSLAMSLLKLGKLGKPLAVTAGTLELMFLFLSARMDILMPRGMIPSLVAVILSNVTFSRLKIVFDADGLVADERADFGGWSRTGLRYRFFIKIEEKMLLYASSVIVRTDDAKVILSERHKLSDLQQEKIQVIPNGKDPDLFTPLPPEKRLQMKERLQIPGTSPIVVYVGSYGPQYYPEKILEFFHLIFKKQSDARLFILSKADQQWEMTLSNFPEVRESVSLLNLPAKEVVPYLGIADLGISLRMDCLSQRAVSPIKVAEYLLCGVPLFENDSIQKETGLDETGITVKGLDREGLQQAANLFLEKIMNNRESFRESCRKTGLKLYSVNNVAKKWSLAIQAASEKD